MNEKVRISSIISGKSFKNKHIKMFVCLLICFLTAQGPGCHRNMVEMTVQKDGQIICIGHLVRDKIRPAE